MSKRKKRIKKALSQADCASSTLSAVRKYVERDHECSGNPYCSDCKETQCHFYQRYGEYKICLLSKTLDRLEIFELYLEGLIG